MKLTNSTTTGTPIMSIFYVPFFRQKPSLIKTELNHNKTLIRRQLKFTYYSHITHFDIIHTKFIISQLTPKD